MPTYLPATQVARSFPARLTFRGEAIDALLELIDRYVETQEGSDLVARVARFLTEDLPDAEYHTDLIEYLPEQRAQRSYPEKITLRGQEVGALRRLASSADGAQDDHTRALIRFMQRRTGQHSTAVHVTAGKEATASA